MISFLLPRYHVLWYVIFYVSCNLLLCCVIICGISVLVVSCHLIWGMLCAMLYFSCVMAPFDVLCRPVLCHVTFWFALPSLNLSLSSLMYHVTYWCNIPSFGVACHLWLCHAIFCCAIRLSTGISHPVFHILDLNLLRIYIKINQQDVLTLVYSF